ncbi:DUF4335 domain-containing protein [Oscillatoria sp. FACHB-1406]|uniref:DUF4335 domain-containing protein n=1 Tax=Oscillatoria sp. FACHB-1406 TaxID=2692846 RepID=UPI001688519B|nr:DUF4335 domain-containing protein [Oscillatoria sp. FACHB-1406]MBD2578853.1 DUF4335 domain-containing protein [Oscillatoria sp. FACHB-1406]
MLFSTSALRRYTPPTCTLKIIGKTSPLSRWGARPLFKTARFELNFDDPRKLAEEQIAIAGDSFQLERLCEVVRSYVQDFLMESAPARWPARSAYPLYPPTEASAAPDNTTAATLVVAPDNLEAGSPSTASPFLQPKGLLKHYLAFGDLATLQSGDGIELSATQLFDLATALDDYSADVAVLPELDETRSPKLTVMPWAAAVAGAVLAVGAASTAIILQNRSNAPTTASAPQQDQVAIAPSPALEPLPTPPATGLPIPSPTLPSPLGKLEQVAPPQSVVPPAARNATPGSAAPVPPVGQPGSATGNGRSSDSSPLLIRPNTGAKPAPQQRSTRTGEPQITARPAPPVTSPYPPLVQPNRPMPAPAPAPKASPVTPIFPPSNAPVVPTAPPPSLPTTLPPLTSDARTTASAPETGNTAAARQNEASNNANVAAVPPAQRVAARVDGVRNYFQQRWQAPKDLNEPLQYSLILKKDGTIERIVPYGQVSGIYLDRTPMPLLGESFGIASDESTTQVRLKLNPDGSVEASAEN